MYIGHKFVYYQKLFRVTNSSVIISHEFQVKLMSQWMIFFIEICESQYCLCTSLWHFIHTCGMVPLTRLGMSSLVYPRLVRPSGTSRSCMISRRRSPRIGPASSTFLFVMSTPVNLILYNQISISKKFTNKLLYTYKYDAHSMYNCHNFPK